MAKKEVITQRPLRIVGGAKRDARTQFAALPFRVSKKKGGKGIEVLLVSTLDSGRWIIPKGWPMDGLTPAEAAAQEAWEEAGVRGRVHEMCLGLYSYSKWIDEELSLPVIVAVFPLAVKKLADAYPEDSKRRRKWCSPKQAAARVNEPELKQLILGFSLDRLR
ncbi:NUDIX hydrolase [Gymnodinialimonas sp. 2305UL16-5]|uniref:NUDIX hydrolase n=1 Tax=Gymnodinialimonas mytili TaxID=3126503 RepID=UPI0030B2EF91